MKKYQRGISTLAITLILLGAIILSVTFGGRGLLFEQKSSGNQYKAAQAFEAAEAGLEWALAQLNSTTPIGTDCMVSDKDGAAAFRERYLRPDAGGELAPRPGLAPWTCLKTDGGNWSCSCPEPSAASELLASGKGASFSVQMQSEQSGLIRLSAIGCSSGAPPCVAGAAIPADATARIQTLVARAAGLGSEPAAALTARGSVDLDSSSFDVRHVDASSGGMTIHAGGTVIATQPRLTSAPGAPASASIWEQDDALATLMPEGFFASVFRMGKADWQKQPVVEAIACKVSCGDSLARAAGGKAPQQLLWLPDGLRIDTPLALGTAERPVLLVVDGPVELQAPFNLRGLLYITAGEWQDSAAADIRGGVIAENTLHGTGNTQIAHDASVLHRLKLATGTFARVPGSWRDF